LSPATNHGSLLPCRTYRVPHFLMADRPWPATNLSQTLAVTFTDLPQSLWASLALSGETSPTSGNRCQPPFPTGSRLPISTPPALLMAGDPPHARPSPPLR